MAKSSRFSGVPVAASQQPDRSDTSGSLGRGVAGEHGRGNAAGRYEIGWSEIAWDFGLELIGCVTVAVGDDDLIARAHSRTPTIGQLESTVVTQPNDLGEHDISRPGSHGTGDQRRGRSLSIDGDPTSREGSLGIAKHGVG